MFVSVAPPKQPGLQDGIRIEVIYSAPRNDKNDSLSNIFHHPQLGIAWKKLLLAWDHFHRQKMYRVYGSAAKLLKKKLELFLAFLIHLDLRGIWNFENRILEF